MAGKLLNEGQNLPARVLPPKNGANAVFYSAPIPPSSEFAGYEQVLPGSANRILVMAENQSKHRFLVEKIVVIFDSLKPIIGIISAFLIVMTGIIAGIYLIMHDKPLSGFTTIIIPLSVVAGAFILKEKGK